MTHPAETSQPRLDGTMHAVAVPQESYRRLFLRFLRYGLLAWGGPVAQIAMIRQDLVENERWVTRERFNRVLAVYQVLPGPEAHELCVYFGMLSRGRIGAVLAGLGFMLPGFLLMFALSWFYVRFGIASPIFGAIFFGFKPAVAALITRAVHRIGQHALTNRWLWAIAIAAGIATFFRLYFLITLMLAGLTYLLIRRARGETPAAHAGLLFVLPVLVPAAAVAAPTVGALFGYGLRAGLLTFGGAYTAIPLLQRDAVEVGRFMTNAQFLDGLALSGILPAPLIIFTTFVGYLGGGPAGAVALTLGAFLPAFSFTLLGHNFFERLMENTAAHAFLDGVTAAVVGLIAVTSFGIVISTLPDTTLETFLAVALFLVDLLILYRWKSKAATAVVVLGSGLVGLLLLSF